MFLGTPVLTPITQGSQPEPHGSPRGPAFSSLIPHYARAAPSACCSPAALLPTAVPPTGLPFVLPCFPGWSRHFGLHTAYLSLACHVSPSQKARLSGTRMTCLFLLFPSPKWLQALSTNMIK